MAKKSPRQAIKLKCLHYCCGVRREVELCNIKECPLWEYRTVKKGTSINEERRLALRERMKKMHQEGKL